MPEIGEVARVVHYLRKNLLNRTVASCTGYEDQIVYGKAGTSAAAFQDAVTGRRVTGAAQQGKYFYITFDKPPHAVMHLGMTGWIKFSNEYTGYYRSAKEENEKEAWPPKYMKFLLKCDKDGDRDAVEVAFCDARRLARIRLVDCDAEDIRNQTPLKENGPDPVRDKDIVTVAWLKDLLRRKRVPIKALLLDQANLSGVGNWVADEILYNARIHPEQYSNSFSDKQIKSLHDSLIGICTIAVETLADSKQFPEGWLMRYRWNKGKKDANVLPNGEKIMHITVGGRTSAIVPSVQKKTGAVAGDADEDEDSAEEKPVKGKKRKAQQEDVAVKDEDEEEEQKPAKKPARGSKASKPAKEEAKLPTPTKGSKSRKAATNGASAEKDANGGAEVEDVKTANGKRATPKKQSARKEEQKPPTPGTRRSTRISK
ncbi:hypothetical protein K431DRAFT_266063 [Polychaeton citri CBS 116435]|uniref:Formamidopyrimidine-DNA glycosylase catalytic domain-containing protein n=1 Tax=Polychaeton citri CBS 116435 TaxID=1314669 RepID=A0A9P4QA16_9PEZI|nr:hypothetical protein K431DRAFT_266063 [Polychaeton citri CBS 116435]